MNDATDSSQTMQYLSDKELRSLFDSNIVQFGGKTIQPGKQRLSKKWSVAKKTDDNGCAKYIFARPVSKWSKKHGHFEISVDAKHVSESDGELKLTQEAQTELIDHMHMIDVVAQRGKKNSTDDQNLFSEEHDATVLKECEKKYTKSGIKRVKKQLGDVEQKDNSKYVDFIDFNSGSWVGARNPNNMKSSPGVVSENSSKTPNLQENVNKVPKYVELDGQQVFEEDRLRYKPLVIKKKIGEIFGEIANAFSGVVEPAKKLLATLCKNPNTTCVGIAVVCLLWNAPYAIVRLIGYAIDSIKNKILEIDTSQPPKDSFRSKIGYHIAKFFQEHDRVGKVLAATVRIGVQSVVAFIALAVNPVYMVQTLIDLAVDVVRNLIPPLGRWIEKHPIITQIVVTTVTLATQLAVGILTGSLPLAIFTAVLTLGTQIMVSNYGQSIIGWCASKIFSGKKEENNVVLAVEDQKRIDKAKECIKKAQEPIGRIGNAVSNLIVGAYGAANKFYSKTVSFVMEVVFGLHLSNPEKQTVGTKEQKDTDVHTQNKQDSQTEEVDNSGETTDEIIEDNDHTNENVFILGLLWLEEKLQYFADKYRPWAYTEGVYPDQTNAAMSQIVKDVIPVVANIVEDANN